MTGRDTTSPVVSVIMPVYNGATFLLQTIHSVLGQTLEDLELVIVDDGSTDDSWDVITTAMKEDPRVRAVRNEANVGHCEASNRAIALAFGEFIARQDQDDLWYPDWLSCAVRTLRDDRASDICIGGYQAWYPDHFGPVRLPPPTHEQLRCHLLFHNVVAHPGVVLRAEPLRASGELAYHDYPGPQDYDLWTRLLDVGRAAPLPRVAALYRRHDATMTAAFSDRSDAAVFQISQRQITDLLGPSCTDATVAALQRLWMAHVVTGDDLASTPDMVTLVRELVRSRRWSQDWADRLLGEWFARLAARIAKTPAVRNDGRAWLRAIRDLPLGATAEATRHLVRASRSRRRR
jgi:hypothetical protein